MYLSPSILQDLLLMACPRFSAYIFGRAGRDETVLKMGYVIEQLTKTRDKLQPYFELKTEPWDGETCSGLSKTDQHFKN